MDKTITLTALGVLVVAVVVVFVVTGSRRSPTLTQFQARLEQARSAHSAERLIEGVVPADAPKMQTPVYGGQAVAFAKWTQTQSAAGSRWYRGSDPSFGGVPFDVETKEGVLRVDGNMVGLSDLLDRTRGPEGEVEAFISPGDHVCVLGEITQREGVRGFYGDVIVVKGTYDAWYKIVPRTTLPSIPAQQ